MDIWRRIFEFDYQLEMYKPVAKRRWVLRIADLVRRPAGGQARCGGGTEGWPVPRRRDPPGRPVRQDRLRPPYARRSGSGSLAGTGRQTACTSGSPHRVPARGERAPGFPYLPGRGYEDHSFCQGKVSGLTLSSIVAVNGIPLTDLACADPARPLGQLTPYPRRVRACAGRATNRSLTSPPHHSGNGTPHTYAASYA